MMDRRISYIPALLALVLVPAVTGFVPAPQFQGFDATEFTFVSGATTSTRTSTADNCRSMCGGSASMDCKAFIFCKTAMPNNRNNCYYFRTVFAPSNRQTWDCTTYYRPTAPSYPKKFSARIEYKYFNQKIDTSAGIDQGKNFVPMIQLASFTENIDTELGNLEFDGTISVSGCTTEGGNVVCPSVIKPGKTRAIISSAFSEAFLIQGDSAELNCRSLNLMPGATTNPRDLALLGEMMFAGDALDLDNWPKPNDVQYAWDQEPKIRGIPVNAFYKQITKVGTINNIKSGTRVMYFSKPSFHGEPGDSRSQFEVPVRIITTGIISQAMMNSAVIDREFVQVYDFFDFEVKAAFNMETFETPRGLVCANRKDKKDFPPLPRVFSARYSTVADVLFSGISGIIQTDAAAWHDMEHNLYRKDMRTPIPLPPFNTLHKTSFIHDFNAGMVYVLDMDWGNCSLGIIANTTGEDIAPPTGDSDAESTMVTSEMLFHINNRDYSFEGQRLIDDVTTDVWIARVDNYVVPGTPPSPAVLEYFFPANNALYFSNGKDMPMYYEINVFAGDKAAFTKTHLYDVRKTLPNMDVFEIVRRCFRSSDVLILEVTLAADPIEDTKDVMRYVLEFELAFRNTLSKVGGVSVLRFQRFRYFLLKSGEVEVMLYLQEQVPTRYQQFWPYKTEKNNTQLRDTLIAAATKSFNIDVQHDHPDKFPGSKMPRHSVSYKVNKVVEADLSQYSSAASTEKERKGGVSSGAAAGIAIAMLLLGAVLVAAVMIIIVRNRGVDALPFVKFTNDG